jgi:AMP-binding enzyme C-terminal domain
VVPRPIAFTHSNFGGKTRHRTNRITRKHGVTMERAHSIFVHAKLFEKLFALLLALAVFESVGSQLFRIDLEKLHTVCPVHIQCLGEFPNDFPILRALAPQSTSFKTHTSAAFSVSISFGIASRFTGGTPSSCESPKHNSALEVVIYKHPAVREGAVFGIPDPQWGELVMAYVVLKPGMLLSAEDLTGHCRQFLANYKIPRRVEFSVPSYRKAVPARSSKGFFANDSGFTKSEPWARGAWCHFQAAANVVLRR